MTLALPSLVFFFGFGGGAEAIMDTFVFVLNAGLHLVAAHPALLVAGSPGLLLQPVQHGDGQTVGQGLLLHLVVTGDT